MNGCNNNKTAAFMVAVLYIVNGLCVFQYAISS